MSKLNREQMMQWLSQHIKTVRTTEEFNDHDGGIWVSGEHEYTYKGREIYAYYSEDYENRSFGVLNKWEDELEKRGWYSQWYDSGTIMIYEL